MTDFPNLNRSRPPNDEERWQIVNTTMVGNIMVMFTSSGRLLIADNLFSLATNRAERRCNLWAAA